jgi:hypothetical protein
MVRKASSHCNTWAPDRNEPIKIKKTDRNLTTIDLLFNVKKLTALFHRVKAVLPS